MKIKMAREYTHEEFIKKYEKLVPAYPESLLNGNNILKNMISNKKTNELIKLNDRLKLNDDFAHEVIDILLKSKQPITLCEISCLSIFINYRKEEAIKIVKENLKKTNNPIYVILRETFLRYTCNISLNENQNTE